MNVMSSNNAYATRVSGFYLENALKNTWGFYTTEFSFSISYTDWNLHNTEKCSDPFQICYTIRFYCVWI